VTDDAPLHEPEADQPPVPTSDPHVPVDEMVWPPSRPPRPRGAARLAGLLAAAATAGALVAFGLRDDGNVFALFTAAGRLLLGIAPTEGVLATTLACVVGVVAHLAVCLLWGALFALLAARRRSWHLALTAALLAAAVYSASTLWLPRLLQIGYALRATRPQLVVLHTLFAGGLWAGTRLAQMAARDA
jgi:hypothetical protein